ncbi:hypothetical protein [Actinomadura decatromicini]|uniref:hypothetical protein n=1 Tax=Actinomadura decatromicini TaxID=2604572 RepID=UPI001652C07D|nr:hypothetical protein [Actinomadura decatromicini]
MHEVSAPFFTSFTPCTVAPSSPPHAVAVSARAASAAAGAQRAVPLEESFLDAVFPGAVFLDAVFLDAVLLDTVSSRGSVFPDHDMAVPAATVAGAAPLLTVPVPRFPEN